MSRLAVIGAGVSGLVAARLLARRFEVTVFEAGDYAGGHTNTVNVAWDGERHAIDTGFIVFNHRNYPLFTRLLDRLSVPSQPTEMSFSVRCDRTGLEYNGTSLNTLFVQRRNLLRPSFLRMVRDIVRFNADGQAQAAGREGDTVSEFLDAHRYSAAFRDQYLVPMGASLWSCPAHAFLAFPIRFVVDFFANHGMLQVAGRPEWRVVRGGSARYVEALIEPFAHRIALATPAHHIVRAGRHVQVHTRRGVSTFDEVVVACHADQALALVDSPTLDEQRLLGAFPYQSNEAVLHTDAGMLPRAPLARAAWNYRIPAQPGGDVAVTYDMTRLQSLSSRHRFCVSLNPGAAIAPSSIIQRFRYSHPLYTAARDGARAQHGTLIRHGRVSYCGAYWGFGFHEDGVRSALDVCRAYGEEL